MTEKNKVTIRTIAELCGVSISTVSLVLNNKPGVRSEVRNIVKKCIEDLGWRSNNIQGHFSNDKKARPIAFVVNSWLLSNVGGNPLAQTIGLAIEKFSRDGIFPAVYYSHCKEVLEQLLRSRPRAVVLFCNHPLLQVQLEKLQSAGIRVLLAHSEWREPVCPRIHSDHRGAGRAAAAKLLEEGWRKPAFLGAFGNRAHCRSLTEMEPPADAYIQGIQEIFPDFDFRRDAVGEACRDLTEVARMLQSGRYDSWIFQLRPYFDSFSFVYGGLPKEMRKPMGRVIFDTSERPIYPLSYFDCFAENCEKIADLIYELALCEEIPEPMEYSVPYRWVEPVAHSQLDIPIK